MLNKKYISLILIVFGSLFLTAIAILFLDLIYPYSIPNDKDCYQILFNIKEINQEIHTTNIFYTIYFISYLFLLTFLLIKLLKIKKIQNIFITVFILVIFNGFIMFKLIDMKVKMKESTIWWCEFTKDGCEHAYKNLNHFRNSKIIIPLEELKPCFNDYETYSEKAILELDKLLVGVSSP